MDERINEYMKRSFVVILINF